MKSRKRRRGFTLIEVMLVLVILGGLAALGVFAIGGREDQANIMNTKARMDKLLQILDEYRTLVKSYPTEDQDGLQALITKPDFENEAHGENWCVLAKKSQLKDAWGNDIRYELVEDENGREVPRLMSNGPDGEEDTDDDITRPVAEDDR